MLAEFEHPGDIDLFNRHNDTAPDYKIRAELFFINGEYTSFEMGFKYTFICITLRAIFMPKFGWFWCMIKVPRARWTWEQEWTTLLLVLLIGFAPVLHHDRVLAQRGRREARAPRARSARPSRMKLRPPLSLSLSLAGATGHDMFYMLLTAVFLSSILGFWLGAMDEAAIVARTRSVRRGRAPRGEGGACYVPKVVLAMLGLTGLASYLCVCGFRGGGGGGGARAPPRRGRRRG